MRNLHRVTIYFFGIVQGVGFRKFIYNYVHPQNKAGFVQNCEDGSVLVVIEATSDEVDLLIAKVEERFQISDCKILFEDLSMDLPAFHIR
jgi:acylphosphatase